MQLRKRSSNTSNGQETAQDQKKARKSLKEQLSNVEKQNENQHRVSIALMQVFLTRLPTGTWWRILPLDEEFGSDDMCFAANQSWEDVLPLLIDAGLVQSKEVSTAIEYHISRDSWQVLVDYHFERAQIQFYRPRAENGGGHKSWWVCCGTPTFSCPGAQQRAVAKQKFAPSVALANPTPGDDQLFLQSLRQHGNIIRDRRLLYRLGGVNKENEEKEKKKRRSPRNAGTTAPKLLVLDQIEKMIEFALALNLNDMCRMDTLGYNFVSVHERQEANEKERIAVLNTATIWGWKDPVNSFRRRQRIARAVCRRVAYDSGFRNDLETSQLPAWENLWIRSLEEGMGYE